MLYAFFWVIPRHLNFKIRRRGFTQKKAYEPYNNLNFKCLKGEDEDNNLMMNFDNNIWHSSNIQYLVP
jgi:hypothetical protein